MRRRTVELAVLVVATAGLQAREFSLRNGDAGYCIPTNSTVLSNGSSFSLPGFPLPTQDPPLQQNRNERFREVSLPTPTDEVIAAHDSDFVLKEFKFRDGETLAELRLHYATLGKPIRDASGQVTNAVLLLHGTGGSGAQFLAPQFAGELFGSGQLLDTEKHYIILPDGIEHGKSSKPSDGLHAKFPQYDYDDMVAAHHALLEHLGVHHLRLILGIRNLWTR